MSVAAIRDLVLLPENRAAMRLLLRSTMAMGGVPVAVYYFCFNTVPSRLPPPASPPLV